MLHRRIAFLFLVICCFSCSQDEAQEISNPCFLIDCATVNLRLEFVAANTGEDLFFTDFFAIDSLQIIDIETNQPVNFFTQTIGSDERTIIVLPTFTESSDVENYQIFIPDVFEVAFSFAVEVTADPCCFGNIYTNVAVNGEDVTIESTNLGTYRLLF